MLAASDRPDRAWRRAPVHRAVQAERETCRVDWTRARADAKRDECAVRCAALKAASLYDGEAGVGERGGGAAPRGCCSTLPHV